MTKANKPKADSAGTVATEVLAKSSSTRARSTKSPVAETKTKPAVQTKSRAKAETVTPTTPEAPAKE